MNNEMLKPCPFCGGDDVVFYEDEELSAEKVIMGLILCRKCFFASDKYVKSVAIEKWNRRVNGWIPFVMDEEGILQGKIPENEQEILVTDGRQVGFDTFINDDECYLDSGRDLMAIAWMPLPEPLGDEK